MIQSRPRLAVLAFVALACLGGAFLAFSEEPTPTYTTTDSRTFLLTVDASQCKILVYRMETSTGGHVMLSSHRDYYYDLAFDEWPPVKGRGPRTPTSDDMEKLVRSSSEYEKAIKDKKATDVDSFLKNVLQIERGKGKGKTLVSAGGTQGVEADGVVALPVSRQVFIYLTDVAHKKILAYMIEGEKLIFLGTRNAKYDLDLPSSGDFSSYISFEEIKKAWDRLMKKKEKEKEKEKEK